MQKKESKHLAIAGNIGAGKTTLATRLASRFSWEVHYEDVENNPYLEDFYNDMRRWSFNLQVYFLNSRIRQILEIQRGENTIIQDRTIYEDAKIFAPNLHDLGLMSVRDFSNYNALFDTVSHFFDPPDLLIYLQASIGTLVSQIQRRGRKFEENIRTDYLKRLNGYYEDWIATYDAGPLLIINVDECNYADKEEDFEKVVEMVRAELAKLDQKV